MVRCRRTSTATTAKIQTERVVAATTPFVLFDVPRTTFCSAESPLPTSTAIGRNAAHVSAATVRAHRHETLREPGVRRAEHRQTFVSMPARLNEQYDFPTTHFLSTSGRGFTEA